MMVWDERVWVDVVLSLIKETFSLVAWLVLLARLNTDVARGRGLVPGVGAYADRRGRQRRRGRGQRGLLLFLARLQTPLSARWRLSSREGTHGRRWWMELL
jgi:hypothetical protein